MIFEEGWQALLFSTGQWKRFSVVCRPRVPPEPDPSPEEAALPCCTCFLHATCLPTQVSCHLPLFSTLAHQCCLITITTIHLFTGLGIERTALQGFIIFWSRVLCVIEIWLVFDLPSAVPPHPLGISFYKAAHSKVRLKHCWGKTWLPTDNLQMYWKYPVCAFSFQFVFVLYFDHIAFVYSASPCLLCSTLGLICLLSIIDASCTP